MCLHLGANKNIISRTPEDSSVISMRHEVFGLAWPIVGEDFLHTMLGIIDTLLVAQLGMIAIAGVATAVMIMNFVIAIFGAVLVGSTVLIAQAVGAKAYKRTQILARQALSWTMVVSFVVALLVFIAAEPLIGLFGLEPAVATISVDYLRIIMGTVTMLGPMMMCGRILRCIGDSRTPFFIAVIANILNIIVSYGLIFGSLGLPAIGVIGSAWGTLISRAVGFLLLFIILWRGNYDISFRGWEGWLPNWKSVPQFFQIGAQAALQ